MRYLVNLCYDGSLFYGSQKQKSNRTVCGSLNEVLSKIFNENIEVVGSSRTDRGVHANDYYVHFDSNKEKNLNILTSSMNKLLDKDIYIKNIKIVSNSFHSRYSVLEKEYIYKIYNGKYNPTLRNYYLEYDKKINIKLLKKACKKLEGTHNFKAFTSDREESECNRNIKIKVIKKKEYVFISFKAKGFLKYMIRNIVGLLFNINEGKKSIDIVKELFENKNRSKNSSPASPNGLYLERISFKKE